MKKTYYVGGSAEPIDGYKAALEVARSLGLDKQSVSTEAPVASEAPTESSEVAPSDNNQESVNTMSNDNTSIAVIESTEVATVPVEAVTPPPTFRLILGAKVRAGFETVLMAELAKGPGTTAELVDRMLSSGEFHRVAPMAATKRPFKPTNFLLKQWLQAGYISTDPAPEAESTDLITQ